MNYPVGTPQQLHVVLRGLRKFRGFSQKQVGKLLGVNQKRASRIETAPGVTSFDQIARLVSALGGRLFVEVPDTESTVDSPTDSSRKGSASADLPDSRDISA